MAWHKQATTSRDRIAVAVVGAGEGGGVGADVDSKDGAAVVVIGLPLNDELIGVTAGVATSVGHRSYLARGNVEPIFVVEVGKDGFVAWGSLRGIIRVYDPCPRAVDVVYVDSGFGIFEFRDHGAHRGRVLHAYHVTRFFLCEVPDQDTVAIDNDDEGAAIELGRGIDSGGVASSGVQFPGHGVTSLDFVGIFYGGVEVLEHPALMQLLGRPYGLDGECF